MIWFQKEQNMSREEDWSHIYNYICGHNCTQGAHRVSCRKPSSNTYVIRANDGASPRAHEQVITVIHSIAHSPISNPFLSPLELFQ